MPKLVPYLGSTLGLLLSCSAFVFSQGNTYAFSATPVWSDEFDYEGLPDSTKWGYDVGTGTNGWGNNELQYYTLASKRNVWVSAGTLKIISHLENMGGRNYTSTRLVSRGKADFLYGRFEVRAKVPSGLGTWPAVWMLPTDRVYGGWPSSGEIDILEHVGFDPGVVHISVHTKAYHHSIGTQKTATKNVPNATSAFHIFRVDWTPEYISGFVNDEQTFHFQKEGDSYEMWPFDQKFHWLINLAIGGNWGGQKGVDTEAFPATFEIDYVRAYSLLP